MIELAKELWRYEPDRPRQWGAHLDRPGSPIVLRHYAILAPGEDLTEYPPTIELSWDEWLADHETYGLDVDGHVIGGA